MSDAAFPPCSPAALQAVTGTSNPIPGMYVIAELAGLNALRNAVYIDAHGAVLSPTGTVADDSYLYGEVAPRGGLIRMVRTV